MRLLFSSLCNSGRKKNLFGLLLDLFHGGSDPEDRLILSAWRWVLWWECGDEFW